MWGCMGFCLWAFLIGPEAYAVCLGACWRACGVAYGISVMICATQAAIECECY